MAYTCRLATCYLLPATNILLLYYSNIPLDRVAAIVWLNDIIVSIEWQWLAVERAIPWRLVTMAFKYKLSCAGEYLHNVTGITIEVLDHPGFVNTIMVG